MINKASILIPNYMWGCEVRSWLYLPLLSYPTNLFHLGCKYNTDNSNTCTSTITNDTNPNKCTITSTTTINYTTTVPWCTNSNKTGIVRESGLSELFENEI